MDYQHVIGQKFGLLTILESTGVKDRMVCRCSCGNEKSTRLSHLRSGSVKSCGCLLKLTPTKIHGTHLLGHTIEYKTWNSMVLRCTNHKAQAYPRYGGRGITVCDEWLGKSGFVTFLNDMGTKPVGMSLDRKNNNLGYSKDNCRWATNIEQANNKRSSRFLEHRGERKTMEEWAVITGIGSTTIGERLRRGWSVDRALTMSPRRHT